jgi:hypothetical protein
LPELENKLIDFNNTFFFIFLNLCIGAKTKQYKEMFSDRWAGSQKHNYVCSKKMKCVFLKYEEKQHVSAIHGHRQILLKLLRLLLYKSRDRVVMRRL